MSMLPHTTFGALGRGRVGALAFSQFLRLLREVKGDRYMEPMDT
jgi:hypothetical protein